MPTVEEEKTTKNNKKAKPSCEDMDTFAILIALGWIYTCCNFFRIVQCKEYFAICHLHHNEAARKDNDDNR